MPNTNRRTALITVYCLPIIEKLPASAIENENLGKNLVHFLLNLLKAAQYEREKLSLTKYTSDLYHNN
ncbi:hypothetical protein MICAE_270003 [Microcystis aeruginosa PCC 9806]|uniref:Uncharacterized protein n=1 Tax=Microcystis aeruginosa PCC 9806 TaxID=1160282 RepID=I4GXC5_MICAE|nr:hypothetical protein MICAE_270003 [Microcystis aeruginosa PCC 9806]